ncbi:glycosyltransferase family 2 protein [Nisaea sediminum]|uniref:glycosyltransferase family 2 protein n=1 Tax=Nisaea sediminum TaxID=2775867 RepID=UPI0018695885|nr:glycosyltransferase family 2 protein [Nisaea sediminum]
MSDPTPPTDGPACAVVIVSYHTGPCLMDCIRSVLDEASAREIVVVDNGNPEETVTDLRALADRDERVTLLTGHGNVGFGRACNMGARATTSPYLLLFNPDSVLKPGTLDSALQKLEARPNISLYTVRIENPDGSEQRGCRRNLMTPWTCLVEVSGLYSLGFKRINLHGTPPPSELTEVECISGSFLLFPRRVFEEVGGMDEDYFLHMEDVDVCYRVRKAGGHIWFDPTLSATHVQGTSDTSGIFIEKQKTLGGALYFAKHFGGWHNPLVAFVNLALWARYALIFMKLRAKKL